MQNLNNKNINFKGVEWEFNKFGGAQFKSNSFIYSGNSLKIYPSKESKIIPLIVIILFSGLPFFISLINHKKPEQLLLIFTGVIELIFIIIYIRLFIKTEINLLSNKITKGFNLASAKTINYINEIEFIQIVEQLISQKNNNYYSYEINLVFKDKKRLTLTDHADFEHIKTEALKLKQFLNKPIYTKTKKNKEIIELT